MKNLKTFEQYSAPELVDNNIEAIEEGLFNSKKKKEELAKNKARFEEDLKKYTTGKYANYKSDEAKLTKSAEKNKFAGNLRGIGGKGFGDFDGQIVYKPYEKSRLAAGTGSAL
jgi:hypothetical protein